MDSEQKQIVRFEQVKLQYKFLPTSLISIIIASLLLAYAQWTVIDRTIIIGWLIALWSITGVRYVFYRSYITNTPSKDNIESWHRYAFIGALLSGFGWGAASICLFPANDVTHQVVLAFLMGGMATGAIMTLTSLRANVAAFVLPMVLPLIVRFFMEQTEVGVGMGVMTTIFLIMIGVSARNSYYAILESINLRFSHQQTKLALKESAAMNQQILDTAAEGIFGVDLDGMTTFVNPAAAKMLGYEPAELLGLPIHNTIHHSHPDGVIYQNNSCPMYRSIAHGIAQHVDDEVLWHKDGSSIPVDYISVPIIKDEKIFGAVVTFRDITQRKKIEEKLEHQAFYDPLTDLPNRNLLINRMQQAHALCAHHGHLGAVIYLDLDRFKAINDALGHRIGDELLKQVAIRLSAQKSKEDTIAHLSGDEFVILLSEISDDPETAQNQAISYAENIRELLSQPYEIEGHQLHSTPSIGISISRWVMIKRN